MKFLAEHGWLGISLRHTCIMIGAGLLCLQGVEALFSPLLVRRVEVFVSWAASYGFNVLLTLASTCRLKWLLAIWLVFAALLVVGIPFAVIATSFDFGYYFYVKDYSHSKYISFFEYAGTMFVYIYCGRFVLSYFLQLRRGNQEDTDAK